MHCARGTPLIRVARLRRRIVAKKTYKVRLRPFYAYVKARTLGTVGNLIPGGSSRLRLLPRGRPPFGGRSKGGLLDARPEVVPWGPLTKLGLYK